MIYFFTIFLFLLFVISAGVIICDLFWQLKNTMDKNKNIEDDLNYVFYELKKIKSKIKSENTNATEDKKYFIE